ncbi:CbtB domain-containing protein [Agarilytica rhodophyticola]|uniref:CbtB domain-containing protein n=1 Tax=Agarilytica rhodophyticola TaxID=1737490 RepID=UPI000B347471|nr:CbtB domain-containing protein [Agarilytica rhodophyticola]
MSTPLPSQITATEEAVVQPRVSFLFQNIAALILGTVVLFAVGFLPMEAAHNAAHDTRHALAFPCH